MFKGFMKKDIKVESIAEADKLYSRFEKEKPYRRYTKEQLLEALRLADYKPPVMALNMNMPRPNVYYHLKKHGINHKEQKYIDKYS